MEIHTRTHTHIKSIEKYALFGTETQLDLILIHLVLCKLQTDF